MHGALAKGSFLGAVPGILKGDGTKSTHKMRLHCTPGTLHATTVSYGATKGN